jgi:hypothetical protein
MDTPETATATSDQATGWRRFVSAACADCDWALVLRDYRSQRTRNRKAIIKAAQRHCAETGHRSWGCGVIHS